MKPLNLSNLRKGDVITILDYKGEPSCYSGKPMQVRAITLPFVYTDHVVNDVIDTRNYTLIRVSKNALK